MKTGNLILAMAMTAMMAACSSQLDVPAADGEATITFTAQLPGSMSRANYADGTTATTLYYAVYSNGKLLKDNGLSGKTTLKDKQANVSLTLAQGMTYDIVFWAQSDSSPYTFDAQNASVTAEYNGVSANNEALDAFYFHETISVDGSDSRTIMLQRPFAQLNIGTNDITAATNSGLTVDKAAVKLTDVCNRLNLLSGKASAVETENTKLNADNTLDVTFAAADIPVTKTGDEGEGETFPVGGYSYLAMNYVLVGSDNATSTVTLSVDGIDHTYSGVPLRANYRTNIYGALLTSPTDYTVTINPEFGGSSRYVMYRNVCYSTIEDALTAVGNDGSSADGYLYFGGGEYELPETFYYNMTLVGQGENTVLQLNHKMLGAMNLVINDVKLKFNSADARIWHYFLECNNCIIEGYHTYGSHQLTFNNCTFNSIDGNYVLDTYYAQSLELNNCTINIGDGKGLLLRLAYEGSKFVINDCTFTSTSDNYGEAAIEIRDFIGGYLGYGTMTITTPNCDGLNLAKGLWREYSATEDKETTNCTVIIDGETVQAGNQ